MKRIVILISGRGSNMRAILEAKIRAKICAVISNRSGVEGLEIAANCGVPTAVVDHKQFSARAEFDRALAQKIDEFNPDLVVLAGFMRILGDEFVGHYAGRLINIHPSLLPSFPGVDTHQRAIEEGVKIHGCTVHFVTEKLDHGPIIIQAAVPVVDGDDEKSLAQRVIRAEHRIYPQAVKWFVEDAICCVGDKVVLKQPAISESILVSPE